jgi:capsular polysaccharide biosynthesis protein
MLASRGRTREAMEKRELENKEYYTIDLVHIAKAVIRRLWAVVLAGVLAAALAFSYSAFIIPPTYSSSIMLYVNNSSFSLGNTNFSITASEITAAQSLVNTYAEILKNRTTLERVIDKAGVAYTYDELDEMLVATSSNETEIMKVTVTTEDPYEASKIANCIAEVLPVRISEIIDGAPMEVVDSAVPDSEKVAPSITTYTAVGLVLGVVLALGVIVVLALLDDTIHDEEYVLRTYDYPILAKVPDLLNTNGKRYGYYYRYKSKKSDAAQGTNQQ